MNKRPSVASNGGEIRVTLFVRMLRLSFVSVAILSIQLATSSFAQNRSNSLLPICKNQAEVELIGYEQIVGPVEETNVETETLIPQGDTLFTNKGKPILFATYKYDLSGRLVEKNFYRIDGVALPKSTFEYDKDGTLMRELDYSAVSHKPYLETDYVYDDGTLKEIVGKNIEKGAFLSKKAFSYDRTRNYFEFTETTSYKSPALRIGFSQDKDCRITEVVGYKSDGTVERRASRSFDSNGNPTFVESKTEAGLTLAKSKFEYEFDSSGNWIKRSDYVWEPSKTDRNGDWKLVEITYRKIKYFKKN